MKIKKASGFIEKFLRSRKLGAITLPPYGIYILEERMQEQGLILHEEVHWEQWERMGTFRFYKEYILGLLKHGYSAEHPMEKEARERSGVN